MCMHKSKIVKKKPKKQEEGMKKLMVSGFTKGELELKKSLLERLFPGYGIVPDSGEHIQADAAAVCCGYEEWLAVQTIRRLSSLCGYLLLYAERMPSTPFVLLMEKQDKAALFFAPDGMAELSECAESMSRGENFRTRAVLRLNAEKHVMRFLHFSELKESTRQLLFGIYAGLSNKEIAYLTGKSTAQVCVELARLKETAGAVDREVLISDVMNWIRMGAVMP